MIKLFKSLFKKEQGNVLVITSLAFAGLIAITGLVIDGGQLYMTKSHLQKVANAAALSSAQELTNTEDRVASVVDDILDYHNEPTVLDDLIIMMKERVTVELKKTVPLTFTKLFGFETVDINAKATARIGAMGRAYGAAPIGIDESVELIYGKSYELKVDETGSVSGNFGVLALEGPGAKTYKQNLIEGFSGELKIGDIVNTQTGNIAGPTKEAVDILIQGCDDINQRDCSRVLLVPVYKPYNFTTNQMKQVQVTGFAYFYVDRFDDNTKVIQGRFIQRTNTGFEEQGALDKGAYSIRLIE